MSRNENSRRDALWVQLLVVVALAIAGCKTTKPAAMKQDPTTEAAASAKTGQPEVTPTPDAPSTVPPVIEEQYPELDLGGVPTDFPVEPDGETVRIAEVVLREFQQMSGDALPEVPTADGASAHGDEDDMPVEMPCAAEFEPDTATSGIP